MPFFGEGGPIAPQGDGRARAGYSGGGWPIACGPATGAISQYRDPTVRAGGILQQFLPCQRHQDRLRQQHRQRGNRDRKALFRTAERVPLPHEIVAGCTCNGKDQIGLAPVKIEDDPTLRKGDIVAGSNGLVVAGRGADRRGASLSLSPASEAVRARYQRVPVLASE